MIKSNNSPTFSSPEGREIDSLRVERRRISIRGIVQGVGFRPFVHRVASQLELGGFVLNTGCGVTAELEGARERLERFIEVLRRDCPAAAWLEDISVSVIPPIGETGFRIAASESGEKGRALVTADVATCRRCVQELFDPTNRRFGYPFISCTECGPRFTIIKELPYDRERSTMAEFGLCTDCRSEFDDPNDRRFHAQGIACAACGPTVSLLDPDGRQISGDDPIRRSAELLRRGAIVAVKGLGGFHLACSAYNPAAVATLRQRKRREAKPFALMAADLAEIQKLCTVDPDGASLLCSSVRPIVLLKKRQPSDVPPEVAPSQHSLGVMLPYTPLHHLLLQAVNEPLVMTSGNMSEEPICRSNEEALSRLAAISDYFLVHNRAIHARCDDSVVRSVSGRRVAIRRARGLAPRPLSVGRKFTQPVLACGAQLKNTFCFGIDGYAFLSPHIGDLENYDNFQSFVDLVERYKQLFALQPAIVAHDMHPQYLSTRYAHEQQGIRRIAVQHHHAHIAGCMAEHQLDGPVIGVALDGLGYGTDGAIWGGEFLVASLRGYQRRAHFRYIPLAGGDTAVRQPWRSALAYLLDAWPNDPFPASLPGWDAIASNKLNLVRSMIQQKLHTIPTSSCGRLFDAIAAIVGLRHEASYEGQPAVELEACAAPGIETRYRFAIHETPTWEIDFRPAVTEIVDDVMMCEPIETISAKFHNTLIDVIVEVCRRVRNADNLDRVCLSGGTFQNVYLLERLVPALQELGFRVFHPSEVPPNDGGIALGQAVVAQAVATGGT